jgi:HK97 family phage portal protein
VRGLGALIPRGDMQLRALPPDGTEFPTNPNEARMTGMFGGHAKVLPVPSEGEALAVPAFWRGHNYVCGTIGMLPVAAWRDTEQIDPQPQVLRQPDVNQTPMAFWAEIVSSLTLYGNAICVIASINGLGYPTALRPIHPTLAAWRPVGDPNNPTVGAWYISGRVIDPTQVWHIKSFVSRPGQPVGMGLLNAAPEGVAAARALMDYSSSYFAGGGVPPGILKIHRPEITQDQADDAKAKWIQKYAGRAEPAVLNDLTDFQPLAFNPVDSQMIEARQFSLIDVALLWGLPPTKLGAAVASGTYRNAEMEEVQARNDAVTPWARLLEQAVSIDLLARGQKAEWRIDAYLRTDTLSRFQAYQVALGGPGPQSAWILKDEVRGLENMDPLADAISDDVTDTPADESPGQPTVQGGQGGPAVPNPAPAATTVPAMNGGGRNG